MPDTRGPWGGRQSHSVCLLLELHVQRRRWFSEDFPKIYKLLRDTQRCKEVLYFTEMLFKVWMLCWGHCSRLQEKGRQQATKWLWPTENYLYTDRCFYLPNSIYIGERRLNNRNTYSSIAPQPTTSKMAIHLNQHLSKTVSTKLNSTTFLKEGFIAAQLYETALVLAMCT